MTEIKTYLKLGNKEINTLEDLTTFLNEPHDEFYDIEILEPVLGKFNRWSVKGEVIKGIYQEQQGEAIINIHGNDFKVEDVMLKDINRDSVILLPINSMSFCDDGKIKISMGRNVISSEEMMMLQEARDKQFIEEFHSTHSYTDDELNETL